MPYYTVISDVGTEHGYIHLTQHNASGPAHAVASHLGRLPTDIGDDDFVALIGGYLEPSTVKLHEAGASAWTWLDLDQNSPTLATYVVETVFPANA